MPNTPDTNSTIINYEAKVPKTASLENESTINYFTSTIYNNDLTHKINATEAVGVGVPTTQGEPRSIDPLMSLKARQHHISFGNNYLVDSVETTIVPPIKHIIKLVSLSRNLDAKHAIINSITPTPPQTIPFAGEIRNIPTSIDAQPFDELPDGAEFNFLITESNTLEEIDIIYEFKRLVYNSTNKEQESETVQFQYPLKDITGTVDIGVSVLRQENRATIVFDKTLGVFKLMSVSSSSVANTQEYLFQAAFLENEYTLNQSSQYTLPTTVNNGFVAQFIAPANNTGSATIKIQKYDGTYHTTLTAKKYSGTSLVNLVANDIKQNQLYTIVIISGEAVVFGIHSLQTQQRIIFSYVNGTTVSYTSGGFIFDDFSGSGFVNAGTLNLTGLTANSSWYIFAIANPTTGATQIQHYNTLTPTPPIGFTKKKLLFAFITNASSQLREIIIDADGWVTYVGVGVNEGLNGFTNNGQSIQKPLTIPAGLRCKVKLNAFADEEKAFWIGDGTSSSFNLSSQVGANFGIGVVGIPERYNGWVVACTNTNAEVRISSWNYPGVFVTSNLTLHTQAYKIIF